MSAYSKTRNPEAEGRKFWAVVCVCVAGLMCATLLTIGLNSAKADVADVTFDDVTINAGAKISLNGTHTLTGLYGNKLLADETNGEEVESSTLLQFSQASPPTATIMTLWLHFLRTQACWT